MWGSGAMRGSGAACAKAGPTAPNGEADATNTPNAAAHDETCRLVTSLNIVSPLACGRFDRDCGATRCSATTVARRVLRLYRWMDPSNLQRRILIFHSLLC